ARMAWRIVKDTFKVYMTVEKWEAAGRIFRNRRPGEPASTVEEAYNNICLRRESEKNRYKEKYGVDITDLGNYSLVVDTTYASPEEVAECILTAFADWQEDHTRSYAYYCPKRFLYPDDEADADRMMKLSALLDSGADAGKVTADEYDGDVYLTSNPEVALAYAMSGLPLVPTVLTAGRKPQGNFVTMRDTL
ncbi:MAG: hypothetical protein MJ078_06690, partial [Clostridia bacterium]|nr:hypothetical protein [Clostridia bacterium]